MFYIFGKEVKGLDKGWAWYIGRQNRGKTWRINCPFLFLHVCFYHQKHENSRSLPFFFKAKSTFIFCAQEVNKCTVPGGGCCWLAPRSHSLWPEEVRTNNVASWAAAYVFKGIELSLFVWWLVGLLKYVFK